jgi:putative peptidoglycan lipid II flippase
MSTGETDVTSEQPVASTASETDSARRRRLALSTAIFGGATAVSRLLGLVREMVSGYYFGSRGPINAFTVAFQIPNFVRIVVSDAALSAAFVPVFTEFLEKGERERAWRIASSLLWLLLLALGGITALFILIAPVVMPPLTAAYDDLAVTLSQILFPIVALLGVSGIVIGILNSYEHFTVPALTPIFWNLAIIAGLAIGVPLADGVDEELYVYAAAIVVGTVIQVLLPFPWLAGRDGRLRVVLDWRDPAVRRVFTLMLPVTISLGLINLNAVIGTFVAARWIDPTIAPTAIDKAFRLYMLPQGMFSVAIATVLFPALSRLAARGEIDAFRNTVGLGLRQIAFLLVPASVACAVLAEPMIRLIYERGAWKPDQTPVAAAALAAFSLGLTFNGAMLLLNRAFFGLQHPRVPTLVAAGNLVLNTALYAAFYRVGAWGVPLAISIANVAGTAALLLLLRQRIDRVEFRETAAAAARIAVAAAAAGAVAYGIWRVLDGALGREVLAEIASLSAALGAGAAVYLLAARLLGVRELEALLSLRRRG